MLPKLPQNDSDPDRKAKLFKAQLLYRYVYDWPPGVATAVKLYDDDDYGVMYTAKSLPIYAEIAENTAQHAADSIFSGNPLSAVRKLFDELREHEFGGKMFDMVDDVSHGVSNERPDSWEDYEQIFQTWEKPPIVQYFHRPPKDLDRAFAWQRVAGCNPMMLARADRVPDHFPLTDEIYARVMGGGDTLAAALAEHRAYIADYAILDGAIGGDYQGAQKYVSAPICFYAVEKGTGTLRPVAIQCGQLPGPSFPLFTPDASWHWRMAQTQVQIADANAHESLAHLGRTHLVMEVVALAMKRQLAEAHPLRVLLAPHCDHTLAINDSAKFSLTAPDGTVDRCFGPRIDQFGGVVLKALQTLSWENLNPRLELAARGLSDAAALPNHPYREDAVAVWDVIRAWVSDYIGHYYESGADVLGDTELAAFAAELSAQDGGRLPGVPQPKTVEQLVEFISRMVFTASAQHSAVNFSQFPFMGMIANMPGASYSPPPSLSTPNDVAAYNGMLPPMHTATAGANMVYLLSALRISTLGDYGITTFLDPRLIPALSRFHRALKDLDEAIEARDKGRMISYPYLRPSQILQSISI